jgi:hypothetical protein
MPGGEGVNALFAASRSLAGAQRTAWATCSNPRSTPRIVAAPRNIQSKMKKAHMNPTMSPRENAINDQISRSSPMGTEAAR